MSTIKNGQILLYCHFNKIIKGPGTSFQSPALSQKHVRNVSHIAHLYLTKLHFDILRFKRKKRKCNFHYVTISMIMSQFFKYVDFPKPQKSVHLDNGTLFFFFKKNQ